jgi:hypothetical protein
MQQAIARRVGKDGGAGLLASEALTAARIPEPSLRDKGAGVCEQEGILDVVDEQDG